jgi:hypothetical protein
MNFKPTPRHESPIPTLSRRKLIQSAAAVGAMSALGLGSSSAQAKPTSKGIKKEPSSSSRAIPLPMPGARKMSPPPTTPEPSGAAIRPWSRASFCRTTPMRNYRSTTGASVATRCRTWQGDGTAMPSNSNRTSSASRSASTTTGTPSPSATSTRARSMIMKRATAN